MYPWNSVYDSLCLQWFVEMGLHYTFFLASGSKITNTRNKISITKCKAQNFLPNSENATEYLHGAGQENLWGTLVLTNPGGNPRKPASVEHPDEAVLSHRASMNGNSLSWCIPGPDGTLECHEPLLPYQWLFAWPTAVFTRDYSKNPGERETLVKREKTQSE